jgi:hypothetical protein
MTGTFELDPITRGVKTMMEAGYSKEVILGSLELTDEDFKKHLEYLYARVFDPTCKNWTNSPQHNTIFLQIQEQWLNDRLNALGYVFLNDVYEALGFPQSAQGCVVGWFKEEGSNPIMFDVVDTTDNGGIILSFNPDGVIYNKLPTF